MTFCKYLWKESKHCVIGAGVAILLVSLMWAFARAMAYIDGLIAKGEVAAAAALTVCIFFTPVVFYVCHVYIRWRKLYA